MARFRAWACFFFCAGSSGIPGVYRYKKGFKLGFIGERQGSALHPLKGLLQKSLKNPQNLKDIDN